MFISPLFVYYYTLFSDYKDKKSFCNRQIKMRLFLRGEKKKQGEYRQKG